MAWGCGHKKKTGTVNIEHIDTYDMVANPGFSDARLESFENGYTPPRPMPPRPPKVNPHPDIDPYGEENWDDDEQDGYETHFLNTNILPMSMNVARRTIGLDIVSVRPMTAPVGRLFYMDFRYGNEEIKKEPKGQVFCELDPYGEEDWDN